MKKTKNSLLHSVIALLLCISMLIGATFAWFSDTISSGKNVITAGNLDLEMYWTDDLESGEWHNVEEDGHNTIFSYENWEPGYTDVKYIKLVNAGELALNYELTISPTGEVGKLAEVINVFYANDGVKVENRSDLSKLSVIGLLNNVMDGGATADGTLLAVDQQSPWHTSGEVIITLAMNMITTAGNEYQDETIGDGFTITALATQAPYEEDSFGSDYDTNAEYPEVIKPGKVSAPVTPVDGKVPAGGVTLAGSGISATVPEGVLLEEGVDTLTLTVTPLEHTSSDITVVNNEILIPVDVHIEGVSENNTTPIIIDLGAIMPKYLNMGNYTLIHVEDGTNNLMTYVAQDEELTAHNQFKYDSDTGTVTVAMASFSEVALVADTGNPWGGDYAAADTDFKGSGTESDPYLITKADELAGLSVLVSADDDDEDTSNDWGNKYYKLISDISINLDDGRENIFYPIGYRKVGDGLNKAEETWYEYGGAFTGTFDGAGHTITGIYQNTWAMDGNYDAGYYKAAMGLFGYVYDGTIKNLTIDNFDSEGEFAPTGCVTAYGGGDATFTNIVITNSHPQTYNTGVAGIVGWDNGGDTAEEASTYTFKNITVDENTTISALWGSWDVAAAGIMGYLGEYSSANLVNCHLAPTIDVYNDVCGNYQYYWYRYCGMVIGTVDRTDAEGNLALANGTAIITATNCTVDFGTDRHEYYYCEFIDNSIASYTHDYQFSRISHSDLSFTDADGDGKVDKNEYSEDIICTHTHSEQTEEINGETVLVEDKRAVYIPFRQLFGGYGWGVDGVDEYDNIDITDITGSEEKFDVVSGVAEKSDAYLFRVGNGNAFPIGKLFEAMSGKEDSINQEGVYVSVTSLVEGVEIIGTFELNTSEWTQSTLEISGTGPAKITIQDYSMCTPTELIVEVVAAKNVTTYSDLVSTSCVLLNDITMSTGGKYSLYDYQTLYGNGFTFDVTAGLDSDTEGGYVGGNGTVWVKNSTLDNVVIIGEVYTEYGGTVKSEYNFPTVLVLGNSVIANSYISNGCAPVRVGSGCNVEIINSTLEGGIFANLDIRGGTVKLKDVTTINQSTTSGQSISNNEGVVGLGIVVYTGSTVKIDVDGLTQYNCISENTTFKANDANTLKSVIFGNNYKDYQFEYDGATWVNTGILSMVAEVKGDNISDIDGYVGQDASISSYNGYVYAPQNITSVNTPSVEYTPSAQYQIAPNYEFDYTMKNNVPQVSGSNDYCVYDTVEQKYLVSFDEGETFVWDANIINVTKGNNNIDVSVSVSGDAVVNSDKTIKFDLAGDYVITYRYTDSENYRLKEGKIEKYSADYEKTVKVTVYEVTNTSAKTTFAFNNNGYRTETANNLTYVMPDVTAVVDSNTAGIGKTTIDNKEIYYPIVSMHKSGSSSWYNYFSVFEAISITDLNGATYNTSATDLPSGLTVIGGFILNADGNISTAESENGTSIFNYSTGKEIKCSTYSTYGLCYYPDSQFTKTGTSDRAEQTIVVKYRYTDSNGTPYYYYVGYWCEEHTKSTICVTPDTMVTLADGSKKQIQEVTLGEEVKAWDFETGAYVTVPVSLIQTHNTGNMNVLRLYFEDGTSIKILGEHGLFDATQNTFVFIDEYDVKDYLGHDFVKQDGASYKTVKLVDYEVYEEYTTAYTILSMTHYNVLLEDMFTVTPAHVGDNFFNPFEIFTGMKYDKEAMQTDIETYGLFTYEEFSHVLTEEQFNALNIAQFKVSAGKGFVTYDGLIYLIKNFVNNEQFNK